MPREDDDLAAHAADDTDSDASDELEPSDDGVQPTATEDDDEDPRYKTLRDRLSQSGRETKEAREAARAATQAAAALASQVQGLQSTLQQMGQRQSQAEQARVTAYLNSLPPQQRAEAHINLLQRQVAALSRSQRAPRASQEEDPDAYTARISRALVQQANDDFGLEGDEALTGDEDDLNWDSEEDFHRSVRRKARLRALGKDTTVAKKASNDDDLEQRVTRKVMSTIGGRSNSARPAAGASRGPVQVDKEVGRIFAQTRGNGMQNLQQRKKMLREMGSRVNERLARTSTR